jgi:DNA-binding response OmpR family regulator
MSAVSEATVLVVEDDPVILRLLEVNFTMEGFEVLSAADGREALERARVDRPDIVVSDIMMPNMNGFELLEAMRADPDVAGIPIILLSAKAQTDDVRAGLDAGADDYITKPFEPLELVERVTKLLRR